MARHFTDREIAGLDPRLVEHLDDARDIAGVPFLISSGRRTPGQNEAAGGADHSAHLRGLAVDLTVSDARARFCILRGLIGSGFTRIGVYDRHVHADLDESLPQEVLWTGLSH